MFSLKLRLEREYQDELVGAKKKKELVGANQPKQ